MAGQALLHSLPIHRAVAVSLLDLRTSSLQQQVLLAAPFTASDFRRSQLGPRLRINAAEGGILGVEPDLSEDYDESIEWKTKGEDLEFPYGKADGSHTWHEGDDNLGFVEAMSIMIKEGGGPNDHRGQVFMSWLFLPVIFSGMAFGVQGEYLLLVAALFIFAFIGIEMSKPDKPHNFEL